MKDYVLWVKKNKTTQHLFFYFQIAGKYFYDWPIKYLFCI